MSRPVRVHTISAVARLVLQWLCKQPAQVFDFSDVADGVKLKRGIVQQAINELRTGRTGDHLKAIGPDGLRLRARHAYLPATSPERSNYPALEHPTVGVAEHPSVVALRDAVTSQAAEKQKSDDERRAENEARLIVVRAEKLDRRIQRVRMRAGLEDDEVRRVIPTLEEVIEAGYARHVAVGIVAEQHALADGKSLQDAQDIGTAAATADVMAHPTDEAPREAAWSSDDEIDRALGHDAAVINAEPLQLSGAEQEPASIADFGMESTSTAQVAADKQGKYFSPRKRR